MKPDDITPEEADAAGRAYFRRGGWLFLGLAAQNALRDQRVRQEERERIARFVESHDGLVTSNPVRYLAAAIREAPTP